MNRVARLLLKRKEELSRKLDSNSIINNDEILNDSYENLLEIKEIYTVLRLIYKDEWK